MLAATGVLAYAFSDLGHEFIGHAATCIATGARIASWSAFHVQCFGGSQRLIAAGGLLFNVTAGIACGIAAALTRREPLRWLLWLAMAYNLFTACGGVLASSITGTGDLAHAVADQIAAWRIGFGSVAVLVYGLGVWWAARLTNTSDRRDLWRRILIPYFAAAAIASIVASVTTALPRSQALLSAVSTTLGAWGFLIVPFAVRSIPDR